MSSNAHLMCLFHSFLSVMMLILLYFYVQCVCTCLPSEVKTCFTLHEREICVLRGDLIIKPWKKFALFDLL